MRQSPSSISFEGFGCDTKFEYMGTLLAAPMRREHYLSSLTKIPTR
jgi:hypothetical protein